MIHTSFFYREARKDHEALLKSFALLAPFAVHFTGWENRNQ